MFQNWDAMSRCAMDFSSNLNVFVPRLDQVTRSAIEDVMKLVSVALPNRPTTVARKVPELIEVSASSAFCYQRCW